MRVLYSGVCCRRLDRLVQLSHELRKPIGGDEHVVDLRVVNPLDRPGLDALQDFTDRRERREGEDRIEAKNLDRPAPLPVGRKNLQRPVFRTTQCGCYIPGYAAGASIALFNFPTNSANRSAATNTL